jgi:hypothetical protein
VFHFIHYKKKFVQARAKLPAGLTRSFGSLIRDYVILKDPKRNSIQVAVERKNNKIYFANGWSRLRDFYDLAAGGWVTLLYISPILFHIKVRRITGLEVIYPESSPPSNLMLLEEPNEQPAGGPVACFSAPKTYIHVLHKTLTSEDVNSGSLVKFSLYVF